MWSDFQRIFTKTGLQGLRDLLNAVQLLHIDILLVIPIIPFTI